MNCNDCGGFVDEGTIHKGDEELAAVVIRGDARTHTSIDGEAVTLCNKKWDNEVPVENPRVTCDECLKLSRNTRRHDWRTEDEKYDDAQLAKYGL